MPLTITDAVLDGERVGLRCVDGTIEALGADVAAEAGDEVLDAGGLLLVPPFVNGHTHAAMTLFRGYGDDLPLMAWLKTKIWPAEAKLEPDDVYWGTRLACLEMIRSGTSRFADMYWHATDIARAVEDSGIRALVSAVLLDGLDESKSAELQAQAMQSVHELRDFGPRIQPCFGPHAVYTVSGASLRWLAETSSSEDVPVHIHLSETRTEVDDCHDANGRRPPEYLDDLGLLGPRTILAHGCWLEPNELDLIAERGATVVSNPVSNMKLAGGRTFPYPEARSAGVAMGLGTDGTSSNNNLDMFEQMKVFALVQKHTADDPAVAPADEVLDLAWGRRSALLGGTPLEPGQPADFLLVTPDVPELSVGDVDAGLVYAANGSAVDTTVVDGRVLMRHRLVDGLDEAIDEVRHRAARLTT
jgi:5-methylthioadenosine/S-adenosylhomocysteine deaminase